MTRDEQRRARDAELARRREGIRLAVQRIEIQRRTLELRSERRRLMGLED